MRDHRAQIRSVILRRSPQGGLNAQGLGMYGLHHRMSG
jgi:hypothetical protein